MYVHVLYTIFLCKFSCDSDSVIWRLSFENIWYDHHQALFFSANSAVTVKTISMQKILDKKVKLKTILSLISMKKKHTWDDVKAKIENKQAHLRQCQS